MRVIFIKKMSKTTIYSTYIINSKINKKRRTYRNNVESKQNIIEWRSPRQKCSFYLNQTELINNKSGLWRCRAHAMDGSHTWCMNEDITIMTQPPLSFWMKVKIHTGRHSCISCSVSMSTCFFFLLSISVSICFINNLLVGYLLFVVDGYTSV